MRYSLKHEKIYLTTDEVRRLIAHTTDWRTAFFTGDIMAKNLQTEDDCWDGVSAGNDFDYALSDDDYGVYDDWAPFQIWDASPDMADDIRSFLKQFKTVEDVLIAQAA